MKYLVLESYVGSGYGDTPDSYQFPSRYVRLFEPLETGETIFALLYEPRGDEGRGRLGYVGWATISRAPEPIGEAKSDGGRRLWRVRYDGPVVLFQGVVPRSVLGRPIESWLQSIPPGRTRNIATLGRAVRSIVETDVQQVLALAYGTDLALAMPDSMFEHPDSETAVAERTRRAVEVLQRDSRFRQQVLVAYDYRCAVSGFSIGSVSPTRVVGLLDAAHIRPVAQRGADSVRNGLAMTPTLHRLFDAGLFTAAYQGLALCIEVSSHLEERMIRAPDDSFRLPLVSGLNIRLPTDQSMWPDPALLRHHQSVIFKG